MAEAIGEKQEWPAQFFTFEEGRIKTGIGNGLWLRGKNLKLLPDNLYIGGGLDIQNCTSLVSLPNRLSINLDLIIKGCTTLSSLPDDLRAHELILSDDLNPQVIEDALRLHREGKVNHIEYHIL